MNFFFKLTFFANITGLPGKKQKERCFGNNKNVLFKNLNHNIIEQEMNKIAMHTHVIFRPRNAMFSLSNT